MCGFQEEQLELCQEALEVLTLALALQPEALDTLMLETQPWAQFVLDMLLMCPNRWAAAAGLPVRCAGDPLIPFISYLRGPLQTK